MTDAKSRIQQLASEFVSQLQQIAREEVFRMLDGTGLERSALRSSKRAFKEGRPRGSRGQKRTPAALEALQEKALAAIKANPGLRIEQINAELGLGTGELALPIKKLLATRAIKTTGTRRATRYFVAGGGGGKRAGKKSRSKAPAE